MVKVDGVNNSRPMSSMTLALFSASLLNGEPTGCDLVFHVEASGEESISRTDCWGGKTISALRDRMMIDWFFTACQGTSEELEKMISSISDLITRRIEFDSTIKRSTDQAKSKEAEPRLCIRVGVVCHNGAHLSVCFVERLYDHFSICGGRFSRLSVVREHWDATNGRWGKNEDFVWQQSIVPFKYPTSLKDLLKPSMWKSLQPGVASELEEEFRRNPLNSRNIEIGGYIFNFHDGTMYDKRKKQSYRIRCTVLEGSSEKITCRSLNHEQYMSLAKHYRGAGILFYSVHPESGEAVFLLGHITYCYSDWCDFGGLKNAREVPRYTAARECCEETLGVLGRTKHLMECLEDFCTNNAFKVVNENTKYVSHFLRVPYKDYPDRFREAVAKHRRPVEVNEMRWFPLSSLRKGVQYFLQNCCNVLVEPIKQDGSVDTATRLPLRSEFAQTLCIADKLGVLTSIEHIAADFHHRRLGTAPATPPYISLPGPRTRVGLKPRQAEEEEEEEEEEASVISRKEASLISSENDETRKVATAHLPRPLENSSTAEGSPKPETVGVDTLSDLMQAAAISKTPKPTLGDPTQAPAGTSALASTGSSVACTAGDRKESVACCSSNAVASGLQKRDGKSDRVEREGGPAPKKKGGRILYMSYGMGTGYFRGDDSCYDI